MTEPPHSDDAAIAKYDRYRLYEADDEGFVLYDGENDHAWIQTDMITDIRR